MKVYFGFVATTIEEKRPTKAKTDLKFSDFLLKISILYFSRFVFFFSEPEQNWLFRFECSPI